MSELQSCASTLPLQPSRTNIAPDDATLTDGVLLPAPPRMHAEFARAANCRCGGVIATSWWPVCASLVAFCWLPGGHLGILGPRAPPPPCSWAGVVVGQPPFCCKAAPDRSTCRGSCGACIMHHVLHALQNACAMVLQEVVRLRADADVQ